jgi:nucleotide-binding universal stress UspA family protein
LLIRPWDDAAARAVPDQDGRRVLVPLDGTPLAEAVLPEAVQLAGESGEIVLVTDVAPPDGDNHLVVYPPTPDAGAAARSYLHTVAARLRVEGVRVRTVVLVGPDVASAVVELVISDDVGLIALATHGRGSVGRWLHGSIADELARRSPAPVVLCHATAPVTAH